VKDLWTALSLVLVIEGVLYALFPDGMKRMVSQMVLVPASVLRFAGLAAAFAGFGLVWLLRRG
jgi:uncharacterized protein YjeT (DUF2065 family)